MRNKLGFLSLLALLGVLGVVIDKPLYGFFGFAYYIRYFFVKPDELFQLNVRKAATVGFFSGVGATGVAVAARSLFPAVIPANLALSAGFVVSIVVFTVALVVLEAKEQQVD